MGKFSRQTAPRVRAPIATTERRMYTHERGIGFERDTKSELFLTAVTSLFGESTFYETATRDDRLLDLIRATTATDPEWVAKLVSYVRDVAQLRSVAVVLAAEYVAAGGPDGRAVVNAALKRADEPGEMLAYWTNRYGRSLPKPIKRGVSDAVDRLYTETSALRYDGKGVAWRFGDVLEVVHPRFKGKDALAKYLLSVRQDGVEAPTEGLPIVAADKRLLRLPEAARRDAIGSEDWNAAHWSWERLSGWLPGGMDAAAWEAVVQHMGYMALLRNLRNFDQAGISDATATYVAAKLADPAEVGRSRQFPLRFLSAWRAVESMRWGYPLELALEHSVANVPALTGRTLIMVDTSGSMHNRMSDQSGRRRYEVAAIFGAALAKRAEKVDVYTYDTNPVPWETSRPMLVCLDEIRQRAERGGATYTFQSLGQVYAGHDRVLILTDEQAHDAHMARAVTETIPRLYTFNVAGYAPAHAASSPGHFTFGGLTDAAFRLIGLLEAGDYTDWDRLFASTTSTFTAA